MKYHFTLDTGAMSTQIVSLHYGNTESQPKDGSVVMKMCGMWCIHGERLPRGMKSRGKVCGSIDINTVKTFSYLTRPKTPLSNILLALR